jgi:hypothetical protein
MVPRLCYKVYLSEKRGHWNVWMPSPKFKASSPFRLLRITFGMERKMSVKSKVPTQSQPLLGKMLLAVAGTLLTGSVAMAASQNLTIADTLGHQYGVQKDVGPQRAPYVPRFGPHATERLLYWSNVAMDATGLDHTPVAAGDTRRFGEQAGPHRSSRAMAIVHIAMFEAVNAINGGYQSYVGNFGGAPRLSSVDAAIAQAAHDALVVLWPSQAADFDAKLTADLANVTTRLPAQKTDGIDVGRRAAAAILALRANDGSTKRPEPTVGVEYITGTSAGDWTKDPISQTPKAIGAFWGQDVRPFVLRSSSQFRLPPPPALTSAAYTAAFNEVKAVGGDGTNTTTSRTADQTQAAIFWAYDGVPTLCAPPKLYNQVAIQVAEQQGVANVTDLSRLLALVNTSLADAGSASWDSKFFHHHWRPIGGVRGFPATDGNANTAEDATFSPLGGQASNLTGPNFTPPFPAYPSGHATFGAALFQTLRNVFGTDDIEMSLVSDEFNGVTKDNTGKVRAAVVRNFSNFSEAEDENGQSRIYMGIHWSHDKTGGITQGRQVADFIYRRAFRRVASR